MRLSFETGETKPRSYYQTRKENSLGNRLEVENKTNYRRRYRSPYCVQVPIANPLAEVTNLEPAARQNQVLRKRLAQYQVKIALLQKEKLELKQGFIKEAQYLAQQVKNMRKQSDQALSELYGSGNYGSGNSAASNSLLQLIQGEKVNSSNPAVNKVSELVHSASRSREFAEKVRELVSNVEGRSLTLKETWRWLKEMAQKKLFK